MKIGDRKPGIGTDKIIKSSKDADALKKNDAGGSSGADNVFISSRGRELNRVKKMLESVPEVRQDMVVRLRNDIQGGNYKVDAGKVAERMIERALRDAVLGSK